MILTVHNRYPRHDLQVHTVWSDGYHSVADQVYLVRSLSLDALAITDHVFPDSRLATRRVVGAGGEYPALLSRRRAR